MMSMALQTSPKRRTNLVGLSLVLLVAGFLVLAIG